MSKENDPANPDHYRMDSLETIEKMILLFGPQATATFCRINAFKYTDRGCHKGEPEKVWRSKQVWYLTIAGVLDGKTEALPAADLVQKVLKGQRAKAAEKATVIH